MWSLYTLPFGCALGKLHTVFIPEGNTSSGLTFNFFVSFLYIVRLQQMEILFDSYLYFENV